MTASKSDEVYVQCNKLMLGVIPMIEFKLWGLHYFTHNIEFATMYWIVRAALLDSSVMPDSTIIEIARLVVLEVNEKTEPYRPITSGGDYPGEG